MNDNLALHHEALDRHDVITTKLRAQNTQLREELTEKNNVILALEEEIEALVGGGVFTDFFSIIQLSV